ncbi:hypothetical protein ABK040_015696 [Willaertia magna]
MLREEDENNPISPSYLEEEDESDLVKSWRFLNIESTNTSDVNENIGKTEKQEKPFYKYKKEIANNNNYMRTSNNYLHNNNNKKNTNHYGNNNYLQQVIRFMPNEYTEMKLTCIVKIPSFLFGKIIGKNKKKLNHLYHKTNKETQIRFNDITNEITIYGTIKLIFTVILPFLFENSFGYINHYFDEIHCFLQLDTYVPNIIKKANEYLFYFKDIQNENNLIKFKYQFNEEILQYEFNGNIKDCKLILEKLFLIFNYHSLPLPKNSIKSEEIITKSTKFKKHSIILKNYTALYDICVNYIHYNSKFFLKELYPLPDKIRYSLLDMQVKENVLHDSFLSAIVENSGINKLKLTNCGKITDIGMKRTFEKINELQELDISFCDRLTLRTLNETLIHFEKSLQKLFVQGSFSEKITKRNLILDPFPFIVRFTELTHLDISYSKILSDFHFNEICKHLIKLRYLNFEFINSNTLTTEGLYNLKNLTQLTHLNMRGNYKLSLHPSMSSLENLIDLNISEINHINAHEILINLPKIERLDVSRTAIVDLHLITQKLEYLKDLNISQVKNIAYHLPDILSYIKKVERLNLSDCKIFDHSLTNLSQLKELKELDLSENSNLTDKISTQFNDLHYLENLNLKSNGNFSFELISVICKSCKNLEILDLSKTGVEDSCIKIIGESLFKLKKLFLCNCDQIQTVQPLSFLNDLEILNIAGCFICEEEVEILREKKPLLDIIVS